MAAAILLPIYDVICVNFTAQRVVVGALSFIYLGSAALELYGIVPNIDAFVTGVGFMMGFCGLFGAACRCSTGVYALMAGQIVMIMWCLRTSQTLFNEDAWQWGFIARVELVTIVVCAGASVTLPLLLRFCTSHDGSDYAGLDV